MTNNLIDTVNKRFSHLSGSRVVIYGMGQFACDLVSHKDELTFRLAGVMDKDRRDGWFGGVPVVNTENVTDVASVIIIAALGSSCPIIYDRIAFLKDKGVDIYFPDGEKRSARAEIRASAYFTSLRDALIPLIDSHDVISFDVFDTLIMRKCLFPRELFGMLERRRNEPGFAEKRAAAEKLAAKMLERLPTIYELYEHMELKASDADAEIDLEKEILTPRRDMTCFLDYALERGKIVILTSDMYLPEPVINDIFAGMCITGYAKIFVSCDLNGTKRDGSIWDAIRGAHPGKKILHIGDDAESDYISRHDISSFLIKGTVETADLLGFGKAINSARDCNDFCALGTALSRLLSLDLTDTDSDGKIIIRHAEDMGYCFIAPQTIGFVSWLADTAAKNKESRLLFCARDTYIFLRLYEKVRGRYNAPPGKYMYISKRVLCGALADSPERIKACLDYYYPRFDSNTTVGDAMYRLFGVTLPNDSFTSFAVKEVNTKTLFNEIRRSYFELFQSNAKEEMKNFKKYLDDAGLHASHDGLVDYICGNSVRLAEKIFGGNFYLYGATDSGFDINQPNGKVYSWLENYEMPQMPTYNITKHSQLGEAVYSSPEGTCLAFDERGEAILDGEAIDFSANEAIYKGVVDFYNSTGRPAGCETADNIFGALFSGHYSIKEATGKIIWSSYTANKRGNAL